MPLSDPTQVIAALREAAARFIVPRYKKLADEDVRTKGGANNLVTIADEESERFLEQVLPGLIPGSRVIGEEAAAKSDAVLDALATEDWVWIVDPVDGTANFVNGRDLFCCMVALVRRGETAFGWIYDPLGVKTLWAEHGAGAFITRDGGDEARRQHMPPPPSDRLNDMVAALYNKELSALKGKFARIQWSGCAGHDYWAATEGRLDVYAFRNLKPWDHAPGALIHTEAGGYTRLLSGERYNPAAQGQSGILGAPNADIWTHIVEAWRREK
ncbi:MAG: inositol monophosphatase [Rhodospirillaceae bacterium]|nr:inositol monophosphatase [Rhodospirillaceae bacterium]